MNICLVRPPVGINSVIHPLNIGYISAAIREKWDNVAFVDGELFALRYEKRFGKSSWKKPEVHTFWNAMADEVLKNSPDVIAFSCYTVSMTSSYRICMTLLNRGFNGCFILGGIHPTIQPEETLRNFHEIKPIIVIGEGERTIVHLLERLKSRKPLSEIPGIAYYHDGKIQINSPQTLIENLDDLPLPDRYWGKQKYIDHIVLTSRGCPFHCAFCNSKHIWTKKVRYRSPEHVLKELLAIKNLGLHFVRIGDDTFTLNRKHVLNISSAIQRAGLQKHLSFSVGSRIDIIDEEKLFYLKSMGVVNISFGVESGSSRQQKLLKKNLDLSKVVEKVKLVNDQGISSHTFFILGLPEETKQDLDETFSLIIHLMKKAPSNEIAINLARPYPGTEWWEYATKKLGNFFDLYKDGFRYHHHNLDLTAKINLTTMTSDELLSIISKIEKKISKFNQVAKMRKLFIYFRKTPILILERLINFLKKH